MTKSFWMKDQKGNFSNGGDDTFDETRDYIGIRLQQGVPLLDRDWNELEDLRRNQDRIIRKNYLGDGTPDNGFAISQIAGKVDDFTISKGRCLVDGFEAVNRADKTYKSQKDVPSLTIPDGKRTDTVYIDLWISEIHGTDELKNDQDIKMETCARHRVEWKALVNETGKPLDPVEYHHYYQIAIIERDGKNIIAIKDLRTALRINPLFGALTVTDDERIGIGTVDPKRILHVEGGEIHSGGVNGSTAGFSFANRDAPNNGAYVESGADGQRWVWYAHGQAACLWSGNDKLSVDKAGNMNLSGAIAFSGSAERRVYGDSRAGSNSVILKGKWDELEIKGRVIDWTGSNLHIGYQNDHKNDFIYIGYGDKRIKGLEINHGPVVGVKTADNVGLKLNSADGGGVIYAQDMNHSIFLRVGLDGTVNVTDYHQHGAHRFFTGGSVEAQIERMRITTNGAIGIGTTDPKRILHVEGTEIHSGNANGGYSGFSFANRDAPNNGAYVESAADGQRWVWYAAGQSARLWAAGDKLSINKNGDMNISGGITLGGSPGCKIYGDGRAGSNSVILKANWDELEIKGRVIDWTGSNLHIGYQNDHKDDFIYIGYGDKRIKGLEINHGPVVGVKTADNVGLKLNSADGGGVIYGYDMNHSIFLRVGQDGTANVTDYHQWGAHRFFTNGAVEAQKERMRITANGAIGIGTTDPKRILHVEGGEIHSGAANGSTAGFSFANRDAPNNGAYIENGGEGQRWVLYSIGKIARLWTGNDKFWVDKDGNVGAAGNIPNKSDMRLKTDIQPLNGVLSKLERIRGVSFVWNDLCKSLGCFTGQREIGLIAQEVKEEFPEVVANWGDKGYLGIDYGRFSSILVEAVKELNLTIKNLNERIAYLEKKAAIK